MESKSVVITLEIPKNIFSEEITEHELRILLMDAFYEYQMHRQGDYANKRYPEMTEEWRKQKQMRVDKMILFADKLHHSVGTQNWFSEIKKADFEG